MLPSDLRLADCSREEDEKMGLYHPDVAYSETRRVWYSPSKKRYFFISYNPHPMEWYAIPSKSKSVGSAIMELKELEELEEEFDQLAAMA